MWEDPALLLLETNDHCDINDKFCSHKWLLINRECTIWNYCTNQSIENYSNASLILKDDQLFRRLLANRNSSSYSSKYFRINGCFNASFALILSSPFFFSSFPMKSLVSLGIWFGIVISERSALVNIKLLHLWFFSLFISYLYDRKELFLRAINMLRHLNTISLQYNHIILPPIFLVEHNQRFRNMFFFFHCRL